MIMRGWIEGCHVTCRGAGVENEPSSPRRPIYPTIDPRILGEARLSFLILGHRSKHTSVHGQRLSIPSPLLLSHDISQA